MIKFVANSFKVLNLLRPSRGLKDLSNLRTSDILGFWLSLQGPRLWKVGWGLKCLCCGYLNLGADWNVGLMRSKILGFWLSELGGWLKCGLNEVWNVFVCGQLCEGVDWNVVLRRSEIIKFCGQLISGYWFARSEVRPNRPCRIRHSIRNELERVWNFSILAIWTRGWLNCGLNEV